MSYSLYLCHGGPGSGRYPLGSGERPYQGAGGSSRSSKGLGGYIRQRKLKKQLAKEAEEKRVKAKKEAEEKEKQTWLDKNKDRVMREGSASEILKYKGKISNAELQSAVNRLNLESQLQQYAAKDRVTAADKIDRAMKAIKTTTEWAKIGTETYNTFAAIYNATPDGQAKPLTLVGKGEKKKDKDK